MSWPKRIAVGLLGLVLLLVVSGGVLYASDPWLWQRFATAFQAQDIANVDWRRPAEAVAGGDRLLPAVHGHGIEPSAMQAALAYAESTGSHALLIHHRGELVVERYWNGHGRDTRFDTASMHKSVLGLLLGIAIDEGKVGSLDDPVGRYIAEWADDARGEISLRQLAGMSSGLKLEPFVPNPFAPGLRLMIGSDVQATALDLPWYEPPDQRFEYTNFNSQLLGIALERAVGMRYAEYLSSRLWQPLGAPDAAVWLDREDGMARTFCCLLATAQAWMQLGVLLLNQGALDGQQIVPADWIAAMTTPSALNRNFGLQLWLGAPASGLRRYNSASRLEILHSEPFLADDVFFMDGMGGQRVYVIPSAELVIVRIGAVDAGWDDSVLPNTLLRGVRSMDR
ncbi:MAG: serine hydrolase domain-containing protein [Wenzhouxiangella sp.]